MPDQDSQSKAPDSQRTTSDGRAKKRRHPTTITTIGSGHRTSPEQGESSPRLGLAVNNGGFRVSLRDVVGHGGAHHPVGPEAKTQPPDDAQAAIARILEAQEDTARRIAQSLHDEASQMLALVYLELANIARKSPKPTAERIDRVIQHLDSVCEQMRGLSHELHPMVLERHGLMPALSKLASGVGKRSGLAVEVIGEATDLSPAIEVCIYRVVQEALSNVVRHAGASKAEIRLWQTENRIHCSVRDDGVGYQPREQEAKGRYESGLGLVGIFERVDSLGGECHILSGGREGMELKLGIPL